MSQRTLRTLSAPDLVLAVVFLLLTQAEIWVFTVQDDVTVGTRLAASVLTAVASGALVFRRQTPSLAFWVNGLAVIAVIFVGYPSDFYQWTNLIATYSLGAYAVGWHRWAGLPIAIGGVLYYFASFPSEGPPAIAAFVAATWLVAWLAGRTYGARIEEAKLRTERDLSRRLAESNEARLALEEERNRIARELHDIVGHTVNVMVVHADAGRGAINVDTDTAVRAFETIARTGREAMSELDRVLAVLRRDEDDSRLNSTPSLADLNRLATTLADTGLEVTVHLGDGLEDVPASVQLAAYRIVQEALTNTLRHASATSAGVTVKVSRDHIDIEVVDDGTGHGDEIRPGRGVMGMRERAELHEGSVHLGNRGDGRFAVSANMRWDPDK